MGSLEFFIREILSSDNSRPWFFTVVWLFSLKTMPRALQIRPCLLSFVLSAAVVAATCPDGWTEAGGSCYMITPKLYQFAECSAACLPGGLACVQNKEENNYLAKDLSSGTKGHWIGYTDQTTESSWEWLSPTCTDNTYTNFAGLHGVGDCAVMMGVDNPKYKGKSQVEDYCGHWSDVECSGGTFGRSEHQSSKGRRTNKDYFGGWQCACEYNPEGVPFSKPASALKRWEKAAKDAEPLYMLFTGLAVLVAALLIFYYWALKSWGICKVESLLCFACELAENGLRKELRVCALTVLPACLIFFGLLFCMIGTSFAAIYWRQTVVFYRSGKDPCTRTEPNIAQAHATSFMGCVALLIGAFAYCVPMAFRKAFPTAPVDDPALTLGAQDAAQVSNSEDDAAVDSVVIQGARVELELGLIQTAQVASQEGGGQSIPPLKDILGELQTAHTQGRISGEEHARAKADAIRDFHAKKC
mmetsp:Transcript_57358/g.115129  ORF Transcript_57358/g.115129 Transcript_57358/m.115129 type:complete len:472 (-) Transcript_57358:143-1558(-)